LALVLVALSAARVSGEPGSDGPSSLDKRRVVHRVVSDKVAERLRLAERALRYAAVAIPETGNQAESLVRTRGNSYFRVLATRDLGKPRELESRMTSRRAKRAVDDRRDGVLAGVVSCTRGGNCWELARVAEHYLAMQRHDETISVVAVEGHDHSYVLIGDHLREPAEDIVVVDPWVRNPRPVRLSDYVFFKPEQAYEVRARVRGGNRRARNQIRRLVSRELRASLEVRPSRRLTKTNPRIATLRGVRNVRYPSRSNVIYQTAGGAPVLRRDGAMPGGGRRAEGGSAGAARPRRAR
jgi:hypothetical protein